MVSKISVVICVVMAIVNIEAFSIREPTLSQEDQPNENVAEHERFKRQNPFQPFASLLSDPLNSVSQGGKNPLSHLQNGAAEVAKNFPQPLRFKRHLQPVFSLFGDHLNRVAKAFEDLTGLDKSSSSTTTTTTTTTTTAKPNSS